MKKLIVLAVALTFAAGIITLSSQETVYIQTTFVPVEQKVEDPGTVEKIITAGGFGKAIFTSKDGKVRFELPIYPPGHVLSDQELKDQLNYQWPDGVTSEMHSFVLRKLKDQQ